MSATATTTTSTTLNGSPQPARRMALDGRPTAYGDFRDDLNRDGYAVIKGAIPLERAEKYSNAFYDYLEGFELGYRRDDPSTVKQSNLPVINEKGMILSYGVTHEQWVWDIRGEPGVVEFFERVYDDKDLAVSFDVVNVQFSKLSDSHKDRPQKRVFDSNPWPHQDQDPSKPGSRCLQGLVSLNPSGPDDGGLIVCAGGHKVSEQFHREMADEPRIPAWTPEWFGFTESGMTWLRDNGLQWVKVCADPGDLIVWDSRTPHYNVPPEGRKRLLERLGTTHWPNAVHVALTSVAMGDGKPCPKSRDRPAQDPVLNARTYRLMGVP
ncbi:Phytanoyl-CoA dioxygenase PhyH [Aspergillus sp. HF37]|nr:Phytanoyl-CoA dioxygenase PhyH [Aspergillus sp. HF37]